MKLIELRGKHGSVIGNYTQVDDEDYEELNRYKWYTRKAPDTYYVMRGYGTKEMSMHRIILNTINNNREIKIDHKDGNGLNNQKENLRICTHSQNMANRKKKENASSKYIGVSKNPKSPYWMSKCTKNKKQYAKLHKSEIEAALWYNEKAKELHGEYARLNIIN